MKKITLANALLTSILVTCRVLKNEANLIDCPQAGGLLITRCVQIGDKTLGITTDLKLEVCDDAGPREHMIYEFDEVDLAIDELTS